MIKKSDLQLVAALALAVAVFTGAPNAGYAAKHDSNTLHKLGKAIQYPVRKDTENLSVDTHRTEHRKSVESMRPQRATAVVTPNGKQFVIHHRGNAASMYAHHRHHRHHRHH
jgi:hypothetical protein